MTKIFIGSPSGEMSQHADKLFRVFGGLSGEMSLEDVPLAPGVVIDDITKGDSDPLQVVVEVPAGKSTRGWNYRPSALKDIVDRVMTDTLAGYKGHQKPEDVSNQFLDPATHWVGAKMVGDKAYFRGVVDKNEPRLKDNIRSKRIKTVSIFGRPAMQQVAGETHVVGYDAMSIDWTPLGRAGMPTRIMAMSGEMWDLDGVGPTGEQKKEEDGKMDWEQVLAELKKKYGQKGFTFATLAGEMGLSEQEVFEGLGKDFVDKVNRAVEVTDKAEKILGLSGEMAVDDFFKSLKTASDKLAAADRDKIISEVIKEKVTSEQVRGEMADDKTIIGRLWSAQAEKLAVDATKEVIAGEMDSFLKDPVVAGIIQNTHTPHRRPYAGGGSGSGGSEGVFKPNSTRSLS